MHRARFALAVLAVFLVSLGVSARVASRLTATVWPGASSQNSLPSQTPSISAIGPVDPPDGVAYRLPWPWPGMKPLPSTASWQPVPAREIDRFALSEDRNVLDRAFAPRRLEAGVGAVAGPALAVAGLNAVNTINLGLHDRDALPQQAIELRNVGDEPLTISRIYSACGCLTDTSDDAAIGPAGWLEPELVLAPGASSILRLQLRMDGGDFRTGEAMALYLQIYSNDPRTEPFDPSDPFSHEVRLRLVAGLHALTRVTPMP